ncbi:MAG TPA: PAS domain S-box protein, partial [Acidobacteriota bacterium]|nr:PAS domain S-box protein [Acidobacteriota bacterium]
LARDITDRRQAEENLREAEKRYRGIFDNATVGIFQSTPEGTVLTANPAAARIYGYESTEAFIAGVTDIGYQLFLNPQRRDELKRLLQDQGSVEEFEFEALKKDGSRIWISENVRAVRDQSGTLVYYEGFLKDITQHKRAEEELRESAARFRQIAETITEVFWLADPEMKYIFYVSPAYEKIWGRTRESLYEKPTSFAETIHPDDRDRAFEEMRSRVGEVFELEFRIVRPDGEIRWIRDRGFPIRHESGKLIRVTGIAQDITDQKRSEDERAQLINQLQQAQKMEAIGQLAGGVAHDFNNILMAVSGFAELLLMKMNELDPLRSDVVQLQKAAQQGANLTRQLLAFSRKQVLSPKVLDVKASISGMKEMLQRLIGQDIELETYFSRRLGQIEADPGQFDQVLMNLAVNARDAMPNGGKLTIEASNIEVDESFAAPHVDLNLGPYVVIAVSDTGVGMNESTMNHIFEPFFTTKPEGQGTGLGL